MGRIIRGANASAVRRGRNENCAKVRKCDGGKKREGSCLVARASEEGESRQFDDGKIDSDSVCTQQSGKTLKIKSNTEAH